MLWNSYGSVNYSLKSLSDWCRALSAGWSSPLLVCPSHEDHQLQLAARVTALGALHATYVVRLSSFYLCTTFLVLFTWSQSVKIASSSVVILLCFNLVTTHLRYLSHDRVMRSSWAVTGKLMEVILCDWLGLCVSDFCRMFSDLFFLISDRVPILPQ